jgi:hypothetical protein
VFVILVTGGRRFNEPTQLYDGLDQAAVGHEQVALRHGRCNPQRESGAVVRWDLALTYPAAVQRSLLGADWHAHLHALERGWTIQERAADWKRYGKPGGGIRNQEMVDETPRPNVVVAAPDLASKGTWDCVRRARAVGIPVEGVGIAWRRALVMRDGRTWGEYLDETAARGMPSEPGVPDDLEALRARLGELRKQR